MDEYTIIGITDAAQLPERERRPAKWQTLVEQVLAMAPGQTLLVHFPDCKTATRARNAVREGANQQARAIVVRTRLVQHEDGGATLYLARVFSTQSNAGAQSGDI